MIPEGKVCAYGKIADYAGLPGRARYVSTALKSAPSSLNLPWHRVVNSQGKISFPEHTEPYREQLQRLRSEGVMVNRGKVALASHQWRPDLATLVLSMPF